MTVRKSLVCGVLLGSACVLGFRGEVVRTGEHSMTGIETLRVDLPDTPLPVVSCVAVGSSPESCAFDLEYELTWRSVAGTEKDAKNSVLEPGDLILQRDGDFATLRASVPVDLVDLLDLEVNDMRLPADRDLDLITGIGDVSVAGHEGNLTIDIDIGDVDVSCNVDQKACGAGGVVVETNNGSIKVYSNGNVDLDTGNGPVELYQQGGAQRDVFIYTGRGDVVIELSSDANLDLKIKGRDITIRTDTVDTISHKSFEREVGNGTHHVEVTARHGDVDITLAD